MPGVSPNPGVTVGAGLQQGVSVGSGGVYGFVSGGPVGPVYAAFSAVDKSAELTLSNSNRTITSTLDSWKSARATQGKSTGKWYFEVTMTAGHHILGLADSTANILGTYVGAAANSVGLRTETGAVFSAGFSFPGTSPGGSLVAATFGIAIDLDARKIWVRKNSDAFPGSGDPAAGTNPFWTYASTLTLLPAVSVYTSGAAVTLNAGQEAFIGAVPSGFNAGWYE